MVNSKAKGSGKSKIIFYILGTLTMAVAISFGVLTLSKMKLPGPQTAVHTEVPITNPATITTPSDDYKLIVGNELDKVSTLSAQIKDSNTWLTIDLPALDFKAEL